MTDNDIIKALECCMPSGSTRTIYENCTKCPLFNDENCAETIRCGSLNLITRQKAEIERLETENKNLLKKLCKKSQTASKAVRKLIRSEAIKEFAERLKENIRMNCFCEKYVFEKDIDNLVKEMVGGEE